MALVERRYHPIRGGGSSAVCDAYFTYYHYLIYDIAVKNAKGIEVRLYAHSCTVCDNPPYTISIMKSQEGRNLRRHRD